MIVSDEERQNLCAVISTGKAAAYKLTRARILLQADPGPQGPAWFDEQIQQALIETRQPIETEPGQVERYDYAYERNEVSNLCRLCAPFKGWRHVHVTGRRTKVDFAHCIKDLLTIYYPHAEMVTLVMDHLNTPHPSALYDAFEPAEAQSLLDRCDFHDTLHHGSWLTIVLFEGAFAYPVPGQEKNVASLRQ